jgi:hypothetical protein
MFEVIATAGGANEKAEVSACGGQRLRDVAADKSGGACDEHLHCRFSVLRSPLGLRSSVIILR